MPADVPADAAYQGAPGAYSEQAARALLGAGVVLLPRATLEDMFQSLAAGQARHAVVPVENSLTGTVPGAYELLLASGLQVIAETQVRIEHALVAPPGVALDRVTRVLSHPVALAQCRQFFGRHPRIAPVPVFDTAGAVEIVVREADGTSAALAAPRTAALYGADVIAEGLQDHAENWTRFLLATSAPAGAAVHGRQKALVTFGLPHVPGALYHAIAPLAAHGLNLTRIQSQPVHGRPFEYRFLVEMTAETHRAIENALDAMREVTEALTLFGHYPA